MKYINMVILICAAVIAAKAENYLINGGQASEIQYEMTQDIVPSEGILKLSVGYVIPKSFSSPSYSQTVKRFNIQFSVPPTTSRKKLDIRGNEVMQVEWALPKNPIRATTKMLVINQTKLKSLVTTAPFPLVRVPPEAEPYLESTRLAPSDDESIQDKARQLTASAQTEFDAVQQILSWIVDRLQYVQRPQSYEAMYSFRTGKGNCQNYSHLAAALMRAAGIPVRIVNGVTLKEPYEMKVKGGILSMRMAQGRHSWIEVFFPDLNWVPFDPQQMELFISNRFIRVEIGLDNEETVNDGNVRWRKSMNSISRPSFRETIAAGFIRDEVDLYVQKQPYGPKKMLFSPPVEASFTELAFMPAEEATASVSGPAKDFTIPDTLGNLDFPQNADFIETRESAETESSGEMVLKKNFLVETAEYVTSNGQRYAQSFILNRSMQVQKASLALHCFGGDGKLWLELMKDDGAGKPAELVETSDLAPLNPTGESAGYTWQDFTFLKNQVRLDPGRYWIALAYTGSPVVNWFFSYAKNVGPNDGTRFNTMFDETWSRSLTYEFNYRIIGLAAR